MSAGVPSAFDVDSLSREFALACSPEGVVTWCDARAARALGVQAGSSLLALAAAGTEEKLRALIEQGLAGRTRQWEVALALQGRPVTVSFEAMPMEGGVALVGELAPEAYLRALGQLSESMQEVMSLNREVVTARKELQRRHDEVLRLHRELTEAHQGVLAMHAELEDRAADLARIVQVKSRIVADTGHELRTPLHGILVLARLLTDGADGPLTTEQARQVQFIRKSAEDLLQLVDDLLELSEVEFGKSLLRVETFTLDEFAASVRGMLRPLVREGSRVALVFEEAPAAPLETDRIKVAQVVRNLVANALKFTESGEVRVRFRSVGDAVEIEVRDTGIGIAEKDHQRIFEEFTRLDTPLHALAKGSGLGLALCRRLARRLGGEVHVASAEGKGATFTLRVPAQHAEALRVRELEENGRQRAPGRPAVLVVEDDYATLLEYARHFAAGGLHLVPARGVAAAREALAHQRPAAIVLDVLLEGEASWALLQSLKSEAHTRDIPVVVVTVTNQEQKARDLGADEFWVKPMDAPTLVERLKQLVAERTPAPA